MPAGVPNRRDIERGFVTVPRMRTAFGAEFELVDGYLNTPSIGVPPLHVAEAVEGFVRDWRTGAQRAADFDALVDDTRASFARLVGVPAERVAVGPAVSPLVGMVAQAVPDGCRVLTVEGEFTSVTFPFAVQADRGVQVTEVPLAGLAEEVGRHDLVAVSVVQSADGAVVDLGALRAAAVPVLLDVTQAAGWMPLELDWADWVVCAGYKWLLAPRGAAWLAVHPRAVEWTRPVAASWYAGQDRWHSVYGLPLRLADGARAGSTSPRRGRRSRARHRRCPTSRPSTSTPCEPTGSASPTDSGPPSDSPPREAPSWRWVSRTRWNGWPRRGWSPVPGRAALGSASISTTRRPMSNGW